MIQKSPKTPSNPSQKKKGADFFFSGGEAAGRRSRPRRSRPTVQIITVYRSPPEAIYPYRRGIFPKNDPLGPENVSL